MAVRRWQNSRRIYVRPRTGPQSAYHSVAGGGYAAGSQCPYNLGSCAIGLTDGQTDRRTDRAIPRAGGGVKTRLFLVILSAGTIFCKLLCHLKFKLELDGKPVGEYLSQGTHTHGRTDNTIT